MEITNNMIQGYSVDSFTLKHDNKSLLDRVHVYHNMVEHIHMASCYSSDFHLHNCNPDRKVKQI